MSTRPPLDLETLHLSIGSHTEGSDEMCVMEAAAFVAGAEWTDRPASVSPVIRELVQGLNDAMNDADRQVLKPLIPLLAGSRGHDGLEAAHSWSVMDWHCRTWTSAWLRSAGCVAEASAIESTAAIVDQYTLRAALEPLHNARIAAAARRTGFIGGLVNEGLASAISAVGADIGDPVIAAAEATIRAATDWPEMRVGQKAPTMDERWDDGRRTRWSEAWDAGSYRAAVTLETAQIAAVRAQAASAAWNAGWNISRSESDESWDIARDDARMAGRDAALAVALQAAWTVTKSADHTRAWSAAARAAAAALEPVTKGLQHRAVEFIAALVRADQNQVRSTQPSVR